ncbi:MAG: prolipoprotein diacylglyceryl transferase family protein [Acutalibacteraceae bacterium]
MSHVEFPGLGWSFDINSTAFSIGSFEIKWYGLLIATGFLLAVIYAMVMCKKMNINRSRLLDTIIVGLIAGVIGARLYYVIFYPGDKFIKDPISIFYIHEGGLGIYAALLAPYWLAACLPNSKTKCACGTGYRCARLSDWTSNRRWKLINKSICG